MDADILNRVLLAAARATHESILRQLDVPTAGEACLDIEKGEEPPAAIGIRTTAGTTIVMPTFHGEGETLTFEFYQPIARWDESYYNEFFQKYPEWLPSCVDNSYPAAFFALTGEQLEWQGVRPRMSEMYEADDEGGLVPCFEFAKYDSREEAAREALKLIYNPTETIWRRVSTQFGYKIKGKVGNRVISVFDPSANPEIGDPNRITIRLDADLNGDMVEAMRQISRFVLLTRAEEDFLCAREVALKTKSAVDELRCALLAYWCYTAFGEQA